MGYHWIRLVKQALNLRPDQVRLPPCWHQGPKPAGSPDLRYRGHPDIKCQMSKRCLNPQNFASSISLIKERPNLTISEHYLYTSVLCAISRIFQQGQIIPYFLAFLVFSLQWGHVEKWLIQFWNRLLVRTKCTMCDFPNFSTRANNSRFSSISGVFSALGALRKVVDTVLESSTRED